MKIYSYKGRCNMAGKRIKEARERRGLTQDQLAAKMQIEGVPLNQKAVSRAETGQRVIADYELVAFARVLGVSVESLLEEK